MTTYVAITAGQTDADSPFDTVLADQYKNNLLAVIEGDASAPKIAHAAVDGLAWALIETWIPTVTASHTFTFDESLYSEMRLQMVALVPGTDTARLWARFGYADGATIVSSATYDYDYRAFGSASFTSLPAQTKFVCSEGVGFSSAEGLSGRIETLGLTSIKGPKGVDIKCLSENSPGVPRYLTTDGMNDDSDTTQFDSVQLLWSTGNFQALGAVYMYGLKKA